MYVFEDRSEAGRMLATSLKEQVQGDAVILAIPSGGIPVAARISKELEWPMDLVIVRKLQIPFEPEAGFGAVTLAGQMMLNEDLVARLGLSSKEIEDAKKKALEEGRSRERALRLGKEIAAVKEKNAVIVDDGLASGYTMLAAIKQVKDQSPSRIIVAVPTGSDRTVRMVSEEVNLLICLNVRSGPFAVADAYRHWYDLSEEEAIRTLREVAR